MSGLVSYLVHASPEVRMIAAKAVKHLSSHPGNRELLTKQAGLVDNLVRTNWAKSHPSVAPGRRGAPAS